MFINTRNAHVNITRIDREGQVREMARAGALTQLQAGAWLCASPNLKTGVHFKLQDFVICLKYRCAPPPFYQEGTRCPLCKKDMDALGEHALNCSSENGRTGRHNVVRDIVVDVVRSACLSLVVDQPGLIEGSRMRPVNVTLGVTH